MTAEMDESSGVDGARIVEGAALLFLPLLNRVQVWVVPGGWGGGEELLLLLGLNVRSWRNEFSLFRPCVSGQDLIKREEKKRVENE